MQRPSLVSIFFILLAIAFFIRFPFFFRDYVDRDESTFILMGQSWADGHLPYTQLWDLKPPVTFLFFASILKLFGKSMLAIRFFGTVVVALNAFYTYRIARLLGSAAVAFWTAVACVCLQSLFGSVQGVMSEHLSMLFFMPALYLLLASPSLLRTALSGMLMGMAIMTKLNLAYAAVFIGLFLLIGAFPKPVRPLRWGRAFLWGGGICLIIFLSFLPYALQDKSMVWWQSVVMAPIAYSRDDQGNFLKTLPFFLILFSALGLLWKTGLLDFKRPVVQFLVTTVIGIAFSFYQVGRINGHYLVQLYPVLVILVFDALGKLRFWKKVQWKNWFLVPLLLVPMESYLEYYAILDHKLKHGTFFNGEGFDVPQYLKAHNMDNNSVFFLEYHIGYWVLGSNPPSLAATHPSNVCRDELFSFFENPRNTSLQEITYIMDTVQPKTVVFRAGKPFFDKKYIAENEYMGQYLMRHYRAVTQIGKAQIWERL